jgi:hypothetical protein
MNKKVYSLCFIDDDEDVDKGENEEVEMDTEMVTFHISINALEMINDFHTLRVTCKVNKYPIFIMVDSGVHITSLTKKLQCSLAIIKFLSVKVVNGGT